MEFTRERAGALLLGGDVAEAASIGGYILAVVNGEDAGEFPIDAVLTVGVGAAVVFAAARAVGARTIVGAALAGIGIAALGGTVIAYQVRKRGGEAIADHAARLGGALSKALPAGDPGDDATPAAVPVDIAQGMELT
jgi:hypothetical protein